MAKTDTEVKFVSVEGYVEDKSTPGASDSNENIYWNLNITKNAISTSYHFAISNIIYLTGGMGYGQLCNFHPDRATLPLVFPEQLAGPP